MPKIVLPLLLLSLLLLFHSSVTAHVLGIPNLLGHAPGNGNGNGNGRGRTRAEGLGLTLELEERQQVNEPKTEEELKKEEKKREEELKKEEKRKEEEAKKKEYAMKKEAKEREKQRKKEEKQKEKESRIEKPSEPKQPSEAKDMQEEMQSEEWHLLSIEEREERLSVWADYLHRLELHLDEREEYLRHKICPSPRTISPPALCEFCAPGSKCAPGLICRDRKCQRIHKPTPIRCPDKESCGPGQKRVCSPIRPGNFEEPGMLKERLVNAGFFIAKTDLIPDCVMGKVRIDCDKREQICATEFCITMTLRECRQDGLFEGDLSGRDDDMCCAKAVPLDCFDSKLCRCEAKVS